MQRKHLTLVQSNASLEVIHAHLVRAAHADDPGHWVLIYPDFVSRQAINPKLWDKVLDVGDTRPEYGNVSKRMRTNLQALTDQLDFANYCRVDLVISDLFWLMNNVLFAKVQRLCRSQGVEFGLSIIDEGAVLYTGMRIGLRSTFRSLAKYGYLRLHGFPAKLMHPYNTGFADPACWRVFCLHPELVDAPRQILRERIRPELLRRVYGEQVSPLRFPPNSCLYLSQPLYGLTGEEQQLTVVRAFRKELEGQGVRRFYYKPHHADSVQWCERLEKECGLEPLAFQEVVPIEMLAATCDCDVVIGHCTSALLNLQVYGYRGRVIAYGLHALRAAFRERIQFDNYVRALRAIGNIETLEPVTPSRRSSVVASPPASQQPLVSRDAC